MGAICSKSPSAKKSYANPYSSRGQNEYDLQKHNRHHNQQQQQQQPSYKSTSIAPPRLAEKMEGKSQLPEPTEKEEEEDEQKQQQKQELPESKLRGYASSSDDEFYDGIPRFTRSQSQKSRSLRVSVLGRAGSVGLERAVEVLDSLGSSMSNLNKSKFVSGAATKSYELSILAFEVANTIMKGSNLMQSLSRRSIRQLKEVVLPSEGVQQLVSTDMNELLKIFSTDKREELKIFLGEVVRFGNGCKDPQWHNLDRFFEKSSRERSSQKQSRETAESLMQQLMTLVNYTAELYHELHELDRYEQDYQHKRLEMSMRNASQKGDSLATVAAELKSQKKQVKSLKKKSLWSRSMEEIMEKLVDIVLFLNREITDIFGNTDDDAPEDGSLCTKQRLGPAGLALHYANIILQIDSIVAKSSAMPPNARHTLYQSLPPNIRSSLRSKLQSFHVKEELTVTEIKAEMEKTLCWLVPVATNTAKAHHGFGWVGEWANTGSDLNRKAVVLTDVIQIETLHHADKHKTETYIIELLLWLNHLINLSKDGVKGGSMRASVRSPVGSPLQKTNRQTSTESAESAAPSYSKDQEVLQDVSNEKQIEEGLGKSQDSDSGEKPLEDLDSSTKSSSNSSSGVDELRKEKFLDAIDAIADENQRQA